MAASAGRVDRRRLAAASFGGPTGPTTRTLSQALLLATRKTHRNMVPLEVGLAQHNTANEGSPLGGRERKYWATRISGVPDPDVPAGVITAPLHTILSVTQAALRPRMFIGSAHLVTPQRLDLMHEPCIGSSVHARFIRRDLAAASDGPGAR